MAKLILRTPWTSQPQTPTGLDWNNPLVAAIRPEFVYVPTAPRINVKNGRAVTLHSSVTYGATGQGAAIVSDGVTGPQVQQSGGSTAAKQTFTAVAVARIDSGGNFFTLVSDNVSGSAGWAIQNSNTGTQLTFIKSGVSVLTTLNVPVGDPFVLVGSHTTTGSGNYFLLIRNLRTGAITKVTGTQTSAATGSGDGIACINRSSTPASYVGALNLAAYGYGGISESQGYTLLNNPWQLFTPIRSTIWAPAAAGGGTTYTLAVSGGFSLGGTAQYNRVRNSQVSAGISFSGSSQLARTRVSQISGGVTFGGSAPITFVPFSGSTYTLAVSGGFSLGGSALYNRVRVAQVSAGINFGGTANYSRVRISQISGGVTFGGTNSLIFIPAGGSINIPQRTIVGAGT